MRDEAEDEEEGEEGEEGEGDKGEPLETATDDERSLSLYRGWIKK